VKIETQRTFQASRETVWGAFTAPERVARLVPGVESVEVHDRAWRARANLPLGLGDVRMAFACDLVEERRPELVKLALTGTGVGITMSMDAQIVLEAVAPSSETSLRWTADVHFAGPSASMGQRVLRPVVEQQLTRVLDALDEHLGEPATAAAHG
jgi:carbon monoxide dehydrogenase subunit G